jgi:hypothetical protein
MAFFMVFYKKKEFENQVNKVDVIALGWDSYMRQRGWLVLA